MSTSKYDFTEAEKELQRYYTPKELSEILKDAVLNVMMYASEEEGQAIAELSRTVLSTCCVLEKIKRVES